ncbi:MAG: serine hydrolase domain-containing protein [Pseudomonadota bacterium]
MWFLAGEVRQKKDQEPGFDSIRMRKSAILFVLFFTLLNMPVGRALAQITDNWSDGLTSQTATEWADETFAGAMEEGAIDAAIVAVVKDGQTVLQKGYGLADTAAGLAATPTTSFRSGSVSKVFTAIALVQLAERGKIDINDDINTHLTRAKIDTPKGTVIIRHLLTHTAGFDERFRNSLMRDIKVPQADASYIGKFAHDHVRNPGQVISYSNYGMGLAGLIVEDVTGQTFGDYVKQNIFEPLGINDSSVELPWELPDTIAKEYTRDTDGKVHNSPLLYKAPFFFGSGGFFYSARDMAAFMKAVLGRSPDVLSPESWEMMLSLQQPLGEGIGGGIGLGFWIWERTNGGRGEASIIHHGGATEGFRGQFVVFPNENVGLFFAAVNSDEEGSEKRLSLWRTSMAFAQTFRGGVRLYPDYDGDATMQLDAFAGLFFTNRRPYSGREFFLSSYYGVSKPIEVIFENGSLFWETGSAMRRISERSFVVDEDKMPYVISYSDDLNTVFGNEYYSYSRGSGFHLMLIVPILLVALQAFASTSIIPAVWPRRQTSRLPDIALTGTAIVATCVFFVPIIAIAAGDHVRLETPRYLVQTVCLWGTLIGGLLSLWLLLARGRDGGRILTVQRLLSISASALIMVIYTAYDVF